MDPILFREHAAHRPQDPALELSVVRGVEEHDGIRLPTVVRRLGLLRHAAQSDHGDLRLARWGQSGYGLPLLWAVPVIDPEVVQVLRVRGGPHADTVDHHVISKQRLLAGPARDVANRGVNEGITAALDAVNGFVVDSSPSLGPGTHVARPDRGARPLHGIGRRRRRGGVRVGHEGLLVRGPSLLFDASDGPPLPPTCRARGGLQYRYSSVTGAAS